MPTSVYFNNNLKQEQFLYEDLIIESLKIYGQDVYYIPRTLDATDAILNEQVKSSFNAAYLLEMYIENTEGFDGEGDLVSKFGFELRDQCTFIVARRRWESFVSPYVDNVRPNEGDLIYLPLSKTFFEIKFVEHEQPFYQLKNLPTYKLQCETYEYSGEKFDTQVEEIDGAMAPLVDQVTVKVQAISSGASATIGEEFRQIITGSEYISGTLVDFTYISDTVYEFHIADWVTTDGKYHEFYVSDSQYLTGQLSNSDWEITQTYTIDSENLEDNVAFRADVFADNQEFEQDGDDILDFSETNPFGDPS